MRLKSTKNDFFLGGFSNVDMAGQLLSAIKQLIAMEASLAYIMKHYTDQPAAKAELALLAKNIQTIRKKISGCKITLNLLKRKTKAVCWVSVF